MKKEIIELTQKWHEYISPNHHKDRDCHWYIEVDYAYGEEPIFTACHYGYVADALMGEPQGTLEDAERDLLNLIKKAVGQQKEWVDRVLATKEEEWDEDQIEQAEKYYELFGSLVAPEKDN